MKKRKIPAFIGVISILAALGWGIDLAGAKDVPSGQTKKITLADRQAAAGRAAQQGFTLQAMDMPMTGQTPRYFSHPNYANSPLPMWGTGIRKFVNKLPGLGPEGANDLGQYIPIAVADTTTYTEEKGFLADADYYEIALVQYEERMHSDLPPTKLRGYVQLETSVVTGSHYDLGNGYFGVDKPHYLGPTIVAKKNRPVRIKFYNLLPTGAGGNLFIPVDTTVMGSGPGPLADHAMHMSDPQNPMCGNTWVAGMQLPKPSECYTENRATLHLHGGISPWISDGTAHQWITPSGENTPYPQGVSVQPVPDMGDTGDPRDGTMTFYYTNQQSARLMFYHDHAYGITRLNVYAGEAAGYLLTDDTEQKLIGTGGALEGLGLGIPLIVQDKTFVPSMEQLVLSDETWDVGRWGGLGQLWLPHVYSPAQNPGDPSGVNQFGRWAYGPWFWPPTNSTKYGPIPNFYHNPDCDPDVEWCEPAMMPGTPYNSMGMEAFHDTPLVNGTAYPYIEVEPREYRFRILNAANDRFFNLQFYVADPSTIFTDPKTGETRLTEVALNPAEVAAALEDPAGVFPTPVAGTEGPAWVQIGTEGGFLPAPVVIPNQVITWVTDPTVFNAGNVDKHSLLLGPAERADVVVDFSEFPGKTLILYNDAPAAFPARDPRYDYYTGNADLTDTGGTPPTLAGYGPNTRTVMQIRVSGAVGANPPTPNYVNQTRLANLQAAFGHKGDGSGVFESSQHKIIVGQQAYNSAYGALFKSTDGLAQIFNTSLTFKNLLGNSLTMPLQPKMIQDEMGEAFEHEYGRMSGNLGVESPKPQAGLQNMILYAFGHPPTEVIKGVDPALGGTSVTTLGDGTQIWKITHNGVDTHPIHWHLYDVQLINRVGWDGIIRKPDPNELGWKDTIRISPLEDTIVALRPILPVVPFDLPNNIRLLDPTMPQGAVLADSSTADAAGQPMFAFDPNGEPIDIINHFVNFGWEYTWHCHILSHEEMDMMRPTAVAVAPMMPTSPTATRLGNGNNRRVNLSWMDNSKNETAFVIQRALAATGPWTELVILPSTTGPATGGTLTYTDPIGNTNQTYFYRVQAINVVGDTWDYTNPNLNEGAGFPTMTMSSEFSPVASWVAVTPPNVPASLQATAARQGNNNARVTLTWTDNSFDETGFTIQLATDEAFTTGLVTSSVGANTTTFQTGNVARGTTFYFKVQAVNGAGASDWSNVVSVTTP